MKKIFGMFAVILLSFCFFSPNILAGEMFDYSVDTDICRFSDYMDQSNTLPFIRISGGRIEVDTILNKSGIAISTKSINVTQDLSRFQVFISQDKIEINKNIENAILISPVVSIDGDVSETVIVIAETLNLKESSNVSGEILALADSLNSSGKITGNVIAGSSIVEVTETANITGGLRVSTGSAKISENANVTGKLYLKSTSYIEVPERIKDFVQVVKLDPNENVKNEVKIPFISIVVTALVLGLLYILFNRKSNVITKLNDKLSQKISFVLLSGLIAIVAIIPIVLICIMLAIFGLSCVAVPIMIVSIALVILAISVRTFVVGSIICEAMLKTKYNKYFDNNLKKFILLVIVFISLQLFEYIPYIGTYLVYLYVVIAVGCFIALMVNTKSNDSK